MLLMILALAEVFYVIGVDELLSIIDEEDMTRGFKLLSLDFLERPLALVVWFSMDLDLFFTCSEII